MCYLLQSNIVIRVINISIECTWKKMLNISDDEARSES